MGEQYTLLARNSAFIDPQLLIRAVTAVVPRDVLFTASGFHALYWITVVAGVLALIGLFTRASLFIFALANWIFIAHEYSYADIHHPEAVFGILLMLLAFAPSGDSLSIDSLLRRRKAGAAGRAAVPHQSDMAMWPLKTAHALMALTYFSTGLTKLVFGGLRWMNGYTLAGLSARRRTAPGPADRYLAGAAPHALRAPVHRDGGLRADLCHLALPAPDRARSSS